MVNNQKIYICFLVFLALVLTTSSLSFAGEAFVAGCEDVEGLSEDQARSYIAGCDQQNPDILKISKLQGDISDIVKPMIKQDMFKALKEKALEHQITQYLTIQDQLESVPEIWDEEKKEFCVSSHAQNFPPVWEKINTFKKDRNERLRYDRSGSDDMRADQKTRLDNYTTSVLVHARKVGLLNQSIKNAKEAVRRKQAEIYRWRGDHRPKLKDVQIPINPDHPPRELRQKAWIEAGREENLSYQDKRELQTLKTELGEIKEAVTDRQADFFNASLIYPIVMTPFLSVDNNPGSKQIPLYEKIKNKSLESQKLYAIAALKKMKGQLHLNIMGTTEEDPKKRVEGFRGLCDLYYEPHQDRDKAQDNLNRLLVLDELRSTVLEDDEHDYYKPVACEMINAMQPSFGWGKTLGYLGGAGLGCTLGLGAAWFSAGSSLTLCGVGVTAVMGVMGTYDAYNSYLNVLEKAKQDQIIHNFMLSSPVGPGLASTRLAQEIHDEYKSAVFWAKLEGALVGADLLMFTKLAKQGFHITKNAGRALKAIQKGGKGMYKNTLSILRRTLRSGEKPKAINGLLRLVAESEPAYVERLLAKLTGKPKAQARALALINKNGAKEFRKILPCF